jgi:hypothetical protein
LTITGQSLKAGAEVYCLSAHFSLVRKEDPAVRLPSVTFLFLTSIRSQKYSFIVKGDTDSELSWREDISPKKTKFLSPNLLLNEDYCKEHINKGIHHGP